MHVISAKPFLKGHDLEELKPIARESLETLEAIADAAGARLSEKGLSVDSLANPNQMTSPNVIAAMQNRNRERTSNLQELRRKPAIARLVIADENEARETIYVAPNAEITVGGTKICSYLANRGKGRLVSHNVGDGEYIDLPGGRRYFEVREKLTFDPRLDGDGWDSRPAINFRERAAPQTIRSLRELLREAGIADEAFDLDDWVAGDADEIVKEGLRRETLQAMELRLNPYLDLVQERIFRLPLDSRIALLGPPGTGKTTTLIRRLRQKIDFAAIDPEEAELVERADAAGRSHPESWLMFTPTELLRQYVIGAFNREGVPAPDDRLKTWEAYRVELGKKLRVLRTVGGRGLEIDMEPRQLLPATLADTISWYEAFDAYQTAAFVAQLRQEGERVAAAEDAAIAALGSRILATIDRSGDNLLQLFAELMALRDRLRERTGELRGTTQNELRAIVAELRKRDPAILDDLESFVETLLREQDDSEPDEDEDDDGEEMASAGQRARGRKVVADVFLRALRTTAIARANSRKPAGTSRAGRVLAWLEERGTGLPALGKLGRALLVQRAMARTIRAPSEYLRKMSLRYRAFRREARNQGRWYGSAKVAPAHAHPIEIDVIILALLRSAADMEGSRFLMQRMGDDVPMLLQEISRERRNQILVDEATDFSPVQLACMRALTDPRTASLFLAGDFNQRLTVWGSRSDEELAWVSDNLETERVGVSYRQSRKLAEFAAALASWSGDDSFATSPDYLENVGVDPAFGFGLADLAAQSAWLAERVREIVDASRGLMPTIAVLMPGEEGLDAMAEALTELLAPVHIRACAYRRGEARGLDQDVRVFAVEHIKGLEFEAVFFVGVDVLAKCEPELFDRYLYVGATRAATYLGLTFEGDSLPDRLHLADARYARSW